MNTSLRNLWKIIAALTWVIQFWRVSCRVVWCKAVVHVENQRHDSCHAFGSSPGRMPISCNLIHRQSNLDWSLFLTHCLVVSKKENTIIGHMKERNLFRIGFWVDWVDASNDSSLVDERRHYRIGRRRTDVQEISKWPAREFFRERNASDIVRSSRHADSLPDKTAHSNWLLVVCTPHLHNKWTDRDPLRHFVEMCTSNWMERSEIRPAGHFLRVERARNWLAPCLNENTLDCQSAPKYRLMQLPAKWCTMVSHRWNLLQPLPRSLLARQTNIPFWVVRQCPKGERRCRTRLKDLCVNRWLDLHMIHHKGDSERLWSTRWRTFRCLWVRWQFEQNRPWVAIRLAQPLTLTNLQPRPEKKQRNWTHGRLLEATKLTLSSGSSSQMGNSTMRPSWSWNWMNWAPRPPGIWMTLPAEAGIQWTSTASLGISTRVSCSTCCSSCTLSTGDDADFSVRLLFPLRLLLLERAISSYWTRKPASIRKLLNIVYKIFCKYSIKLRKHYISGKYFSLDATMTHMLHLYTISKHLFHTRLSADISPHTSVFFMKFILEMPALKPYGSQGSDQCRSVTVFGTFGDIKQKICESYLFDVPYRDERTRMKMRANIHSNWSATIAPRIRLFVFHFFSLTPLCS